MYIYIYISKDNIDCMHRVQKDASGIPILLFRMKVFCNFQWMDRWMDGLIDKT